MNEKIEKLKANISKDAIAKFSLEQLKELQFLPINMSTSTFFAVGNKNTKTHEVIEIVKEMLNCETQFIFLPDDIFEEIFNEETSELKEIPEIINTSTQSENIEDNEKEQSQITDIINTILTKAIELKATYIHIEPKIDKYVVKYRIDGTLRFIMDLEDDKILKQFKTMAKINSRMVDGKFKINEYTCNVRLLPMMDKEKLLIQIEEPFITYNENLSELKLKDATVENNYNIQNLISSADGLVLISGGKNSNKEETIYTILNYLSQKELNILTLEDKIESKINGINQIQLDDSSEINFSKYIKSLTNYDVDVVYVGEIKDGNKLTQAINAVLNGHLVLATISTTSTTSTITKLLELGAKEYLISSTLRGVISQKNIRTLCAECKEEYYEPYEELAKISNNEKDIQELMNSKLYRQKGCEKCEMIGYNSTTRLYEVLTLSTKIKKLISNNYCEIEIKEEAINEGMTTLEKACYNQIINGNSTIDEYVRVLGRIIN